MSHKEIKIKGDKNTAVLGNLSVETEMSLRKRIHEKYKLIDDRIKNLLPQNKILSPTADNTLTDFSSAKILSSLSQIGVPVDVGFDVLDDLDTYLSNVIVNEKLVSTTHIRKAISLTLYSLNPDHYSKLDRQKWGDLYARRYGNPDEYSN